MTAHQTCCSCCFVLISLILACIIMVIVSDSVIHQPALAGYKPGVGKPHIVLGQDVNYPPYAMKANPPDFELSGLAVDFIEGMKKVVDADFTLLQVSWADCWGAGEIGTGLLSGWWHGCMTYTHTHGLRTRYMYWSNAVLKRNKPAGLLTRINANYKPYIKGTDSLKGKSARIADVLGWAPTADGLAYGINSCTGNRFTVEVDLIKAYEADGKYTRNDMALKKLLDGAVDVVWLYADQAKNYINKCKENMEQSWDCNMWMKLGKPNGYAYIQTGINEWSQNGTTLVMAKKGNGIKEIIDPMMEKYMETKEYFELCQKYDFVTECWPNKHFSGGKAPHPWETPTKELKTSCKDGYCKCTE